MNDAATAMRGLLAEFEAPVRAAIEPGAPSGELFDRRRRGAREAAHDLLVAKAVAGRERVRGVLFGIVAVADSGGESALRPVGRALGAERSLRDDDDRPRGEAQRRRQPGDPARRRRRPARRALRRRRS